MTSREQKRKYWNKIVNAKKEGIPFNLTFEEYCMLMEIAGIQFKDIAPNGYHLARFNDEGSYVVNNCRFIPYLENVKEKKITEKIIINGRVQAENINRKMSKQEMKAKMRRVGKLGGKISGGNNRLSEQVINERIDIMKNLNPKKYGWVQRVANHLNISHTQVRRFINKHL